LDKARTSNHVKERAVSIQGNYGQFVYVTDMIKLPDFKTHTTVTLWNDNDFANGSAIQVGTASVLGIEFFAGDPTTVGAVYEMFLHDITFTGAYGLADVGGLRWTGSGSATFLQRLSVPNASKDFTLNEIINNNGSTQTATVKRYTRSTGDLFVTKHDHTKAVPVNGSIITGATSTAVATISGITLSGSTGSFPIFPVPVNSLKSNISQSGVDTSYTVWKSLTIVTNASGIGSVTISDGTFVTPSAGVIVAAGTTGIISPNTFSLPAANQLTVTTGVSSVQTINVIAQVRKTLAPARAKTLTNVTLTNVAPASTISLGKADIYKIVSITQADGADVTDRFVLDNGQRDYYYGVGKLTLNGILPVSNLTIVFQYFLHSGSGDYFSPDSYTTLGVDYLALIEPYRSRTSSVSYDLSDVLDFRPRLGDDGLYTSGTALTNDSIVPSSLISSTVQYFVGRFDSVYLERDGIIKISSGTPADSPKIPGISSTGLKLFSLYVPAYTPNVDGIIVNVEKNKRFTMRDINALSNRVSNLEYYSTLNSLESSLIDMSVIDPITGLDRYKTGYLVDNFTNPFSVCDTFNSQNDVQFIGQRMSAPIETSMSGLVMTTNSSNYVLKNGQVTLPYTEVPFVKQAFSTRTTNLNPFLVFSWNGMMTINPAIDSWSESEWLPTIFNTVEETIVITREERVILPQPPEPPAPVAPPWTPPVDDPWTPPWTGCDAGTSHSTICAASTTKRDDDCLGARCWTAV
jgi:hypothetical protein